MQSVELHHAYMFTCEHCGTDQFIRGIIPEMSEQEKIELRLDFGLQPWEEGEFTVKPETVTCGTCNHSFIVEDE